jgi:ribose 5-phosphate isomerase B
MKVAVGADHAGYALKQRILRIIESLGHEAVDLGTDSNAPVDYPDFSQKVGRALQQGRVDRGILVCGTGVGAAIAANKMIGVRAGLCHDTYSAHQCVEHDDSNVLALGARVIGEALASEIVRAFLSAEFSGEERHVRRVNKVKAIEESELGREVE